MDAGMQNVAAGSWESPSEAYPDGRLVSSNGLVSAEWISAGIVALTLQYPVDSGNCACLISQRGSVPVDIYGCVEHTSDAVKTVKWSEGVGPGYADQDFDFHFVKFAQPTQGL